MNPQDPLAQLAPLREPAAIASWPPAPGWWLLLALIVIVCAGLLWWLYQWHRQNQYRRQGAAALAKVWSDYQQDPDTATCITGVNTVLKSVALQAYPRSEVAGVHGQQWLDFLNRTRGRGEPFDSEFIDLQYRPAPDGALLNKLMQQASAWIKHHRVRS